MKKVIVKFILFLAVLLSNKSYSQDSVSVELTNKLGVNATIKLRNGFGDQLTFGESTSEKILSELIDPWSDFRAFGFVLKQGPNIFLLIPAASFKEATFIDSIHFVTLTNGTIVKGILIGKLEANGKIYDMPAVKNIKITLNKTKEVNVSKSNITNKKWKLVLANSILTESIISEPKFAIAYNEEYKKTEGIFYTWATRKSVKKSESFIIKIGTEEVSANLSDFTKVSLTNSNKSPSTIEITSQSGDINKGSLILKVDNKDNIGWGLIARLPELSNSWLVLITPNVVFNQSNDSQ